MPTLDTALTFFAMALLLALAPGPDNLFVLAHAARHGAAAGLRIVLGLCAGIGVHTTAVATGLAALVAATPLALTAIKFAGAVYLVRLAWLTVRAPVAAAPVPADDAEDDAATGRRLVVRGLVMNVTNPKVMLFFLAFLPQFVDPLRGAVAGQVALLGALFAVATLLVFGAIAATAAALGAWLTRRPRAGRLLDLATAALFVGLAARLLLV